MGLHEPLWMHGSIAVVAINLLFIENNYWCLERFTFQVYSEADILMIVSNDTLDTQYPSNIAEYMKLRL